MPQTLIIDPPVSPYGKPEAIRAWILELREIRRTVNEREDVELVDREIARAQEWLEPASGVEG